MPIKIAHLADIHIRNARYHKNYRQVFEKTFDQLREDEVDLIFVLGDIAHTKINLSAEFFEMTHFFFSGLAEIAPVYSILGNHDANLSNLARQDAVSPVVKVMNSISDEKVNLLKYTGKYSLDNFPIDICHYSVFDTHTWPKDGFDLDEDRISICMYHGPLDGCVTDVGYKMEYRINQSLFDKYDYTMLGDIHMCQPMDKDGRMWYAGSLVQQNYGESYDKGYLLWTIENGDDWDVERRVIDNPEPFVTAMIEGGKVEMNHPDPPEGCSLRFFVKDELSTKELHDIITPIITKIKPKERKIRRATSAIQKLEEVRGSEDYRSASVQAQLLREFCANRGVDDKIIKKVIEINDELCSKTEASDVLRNVIFDIDDIAWENMFSYADDNKIELKNTHGLVGIFGPNATGKSSVVDSLLFSMFNRVSRKVPSIGNIVNNTKKSAQSSVTLSSGNQKYHIDRKAVWKKVKGIDRGACSVYVDFFESDGGEFKQNNGKSRPDTDNSIIRPKVGEFDDYVTTSISPQGHVSRFLELGAADRKDYLINILDIAFFDKQFDSAKERAKPLKAKISAFDSPAEIKSQIKELRLKESVHDADCTSAQLELDDILKEENELEGKLNENTLLVESASKPQFSLGKLVSEKSTLENNIEKLKSGLETHLEESKRLNYFVKNKELDEPNTDGLDDLNEKLALWSEAETAARSMLQKAGMLEKQASTLKKIPCDDSYPQCPLIANAIGAKEELESVSGQLLEIESLMPKGNDKKDAQSALRAINEEVAAYDKHEREKERADSKIKLLNAEMSLKLEKLEKAKARYAIIDDDIALAEKEEEIRDNLSTLIRVSDGLDEALRQLLKRKRLTEKSKDGSLKESAKCAAKIEILESQYSDIKEVLEQYEAYEHLIAGLSRNGIVQKVLCDMQDAINIEIQDILADIVPFTVKFDLSDPSCKIYIEYPDTERRYLELASGMEKMISSLAIRVALIQLSSLPKLSTLIIDESFGALDPENVNAMGRMFESLRTKFKNIVIISHIDSIKDMVDHTITIEVDKDGYSKLKN